MRSEIGTVKRTPGESQVGSLGDGRVSPVGWAAFGDQSKVPLGAGHLRPPALNLFLGAPFQAALQASVFWTRLVTCHYTSFRRPLKARSTSPSSCLPSPLILCLLIGFHHGDLERRIYPQTQH